MKENKKLQAVRKSIREWVIASIETDCRLELEDRGDKIVIRPKSMKIIEQYQEVLGYLIDAIVEQRMKDLT